MRNFWSSLSSGVIMTVLANSPRLGRTLYLLIFLIGLAYIFTIPISDVSLLILILRIISGFLLLLILPGFLFFCIVTKESTTLSFAILYSLGFSIAFIYLYGTIMSILSPLFGLTQPLSLQYLLFALFSFLGIASVLVVRKGDYLGSFLPTKITIIPKAVIAVSLVLPVALIGVILQNIYGTNAGIIAMILIITAVPFLVIKKLIPKQYYPYMLYIISLALLFHTSLISNYVVGFDVSIELSFFYTISDSLSWFPQGIPNNLNSMLSVVIFPNVLSQVMGVTGTFIYKWIFPIIYAFVPVGLYEIITRQLDSRTGFFSSFLFISIFTYYTEMIGLPRQQIAEFFLVLLALTIVDSCFSRKLKVGFFLLFSFGLITSHYGVAGFFLVALLISPLLNRYLKGNCLYTENNTLIYLPVYTVMILSWYLFTSQAQVVRSYIGIGNIVVDALNHGLSFGSSESFQLITRVEESLLLMVMKGINIAAIVLISIGIGYIVLCKKRTSLSAEYTSIAVVFFGILAACVAIPFFAQQLNTYRTYHIALLFLAPFWVIGSDLCLKLIHSILKLPEKKNVTLKKSDYFMALFLALIMLFNTGLVHELSGNESISISLSNKAYTLPYHSECEEEGVKWLSKHIIHGPRVQGSWTHGYVILLPFFYEGERNIISNPVQYAGNTSELAEYVFLSKKELIDNEIIQTTNIDFSRPRNLINFSDSSSFKALNKYQIAYNNGGSMIYMSA